MRRDSTTSDALGERRRHATRLGPSAAAQAAPLISGHGVPAQVAAAAPLAARPGSKGKDRTKGKNTKKGGGLSAASRKLQGNVTTGAIVDHLSELELEVVAERYGDWAAGTLDP